MPKDYRKDRQSVHLNMSDAEFARRMGAVEDAFGVDWLSASEQYPLQLLWKRKDGFATNQLCVIGDAIATLSNIDKRWVDEHVKKIKGNDPNARKGSIFELIGANLFSRPPQTIRPTKRNAPGYDAVVTLPDGAEIDLSIKSYGTSTHEAAFREEAQQTEQAFLQLPVIRQQGAALMAIADVFPAASDWNALRSALAQLTLGDPPRKLGAWTVKMAALPAEYAPYSPHHVSHQVFIFSPFHQNEKKNLLDKLDDAAANATKHACSRPNSVRAVLIRIPETISLSACKQWADQYIFDNPNGPVDAIKLYQLTVIDTDNDQSVMSNSIAVSKTSNFDDWCANPSGQRRRIAIEYPAGAPTEPTHRELRGGPVKIRLDEGYVYQRGEFYALRVVDPNKPTNFMLKNLASGMFLHVVLQHPDGHTTFGGYFPPTKDITLFD
jgi:hypothetical protein